GGAEGEKGPGGLTRRGGEISLQVAGRGGGGRAGDPAGASGEPRGPTRLGDAFAGNGGNVHDTPSGTGRAADVDATILSCQARRKPVEYKRRIAFAKHYEKQEPGNKRVGLRSERNRDG